MTRATGSGRTERMRRLATDSGQFAILALDHGRSFASTVRPGDPDSLTADEIGDSKNRLIDALAPHASAILIDAGPAERRMKSGAPPMTVGLMVGIEDGDYEAAEAPPRLLPGWTVERAAELGADAVKISFYFDPDGDTFQAQSFVEEAVRQCELVDVPLFCEPLARFQDIGEARRAVLDGIRRFGSLGADVLKIQFPSDVGANATPDAWAEACEEANELSASPWVLLSEGRDFELFRELLEVACRAGASGFVGGRAIWGGAVNGRDAIETYAARLSELRSIAMAHGSNWQRRRTGVEGARREEDRLVERHESLPRGSGA